MLYAIDPNFGESAIHVKWKVSQGYKSLTSRFLNISVSHIATLVHRKNTHFYVVLLFSFDKWLSLVNLDKIDVFILLCDFITIIKHDMLCTAIEFIFINYMHRCITGIHIVGNDIRKLLLICIPVLYMQVMKSFYTKPF